MSPEHTTPASSNVKQTPELITGVPNFEANVEESVDQPEQSPVDTDKVDADFNMVDVEYPEGYVDITMIDVNGVPTRAIEKKRGTLPNSEESVSKLVVFVDGAQKIYYRKQSQLDAVRDRLDAEQAEKPLRLNVTEHLAARAVANTAEVVPYIPSELEEARLDGSGKIVPEAAAGTMQEAAATSIGKIGDLISPDKNRRAIDRFKLPSVPRSSERFKRVLDQDPTIYKPKPQDGNKE